MIYRAGLETLALPGDCHSPRCTEGARDMRTPRHDLRAFQHTQTQHLFSYQDQYVHT